MTLLLLYARVRLHWGFVLRKLGVNVGQESLPIPPPTTVVGAFAAAAARLAGLPEKLSRKLPGWLQGKALPGPHACFLAAARAAAAGLAGRVGVIPVQEPSRVVASPYKGRVKETMEEYMPVQAMGYSIAPGAELHLAAVVDYEELTTCMPVAETLLEAAAWSIDRVGAKEGLAAVEEAWVEEPRVLQPGSSFRSTLYQPASSTDCYDCVRVRLWNLSYNYEDYLVPASQYSSPSMLLPLASEELAPEMRLRSRAAYASRRAEWLVLAE